MIIKKQFAVLGLGRFGRSVAKTLAENGAEVLAVDNNMELVQDISEYVTHAVMADITDEVDLRNLGLGNFDLSSISRLCQDFAIPYQIIHTDIGKILFQERQETNPCSLCAKLRKGAFNKAASNLGCNKVAYAHHREDLIETMLLSLIYEGRFYAFSPYTYLDRIQLAVIRPMMLIPEADIIGFQNKYHLLAYHLS